MAVGDAFGQFVGTAEESRQPASGVEERITTMLKESATDAMQIDDGSVDIPIFGTDSRTDTVNTDPKIASATNMFVMITNAIFFTKTGTTDISYIGGVQTNV